ncbi:MAG: hypothetical protein C4316_09645 [Chloroflexota bacterium]
MGGRINLHPADEGQAYGRYTAQQQNQPGPGNPVPLAQYLPTEAHQPDHPQQAQQVGQQVSSRRKGYV